MHILRKKHLAILLISLFITAVSSGLLKGSPKVIEDNRIENLNGFPTIGRGYSIYSNRLQSMCFEKIVKTKPTFDLDYELSVINEDFFKEIYVSGKDRLSKANLTQFLKKYYADQESAGGKTYHLQNLLVNLEIKSYYYALDETSSRLSRSVRHLLERKQYVAFFNSCGHHYVRAVGSFSTYVALLQYRQSDDREKDSEFKKNLEKGIFNFHGKKKPGKEFTDAAEYRGLRVYIKGVGLSKGNMVNLIPVDIDQFRQTIQDAVKLMQDPNSGVISSIEIVPWIENPELVSFIGKDVKEGERQFVRQQKLESNTGVIKEINRISTQQVEQFYKASMCRKHLYEKYVDRESRQKYDSWLGLDIKEKKFTTLTELIDQKVIKFDMDRTMFYNQSNENDSDLFISIDEFIRYFVKNPPDGILKQNKEYLYGTGDKGDGALDCINKIYDTGLDKADYRRIPSCVRAMKYNRLGTNFLDQYCMPKPSKIVYQKEKMKSGVNEKTGTKSDVNLTDDKDKVKGKPDSLKDLMDKKEKEESKEEKKEEKKGPPKNLEDMKEDVKQ
jgi:hypothetical protein